MNETHESILYSLKDLMEKSNLSGDQKSNIKKIICLNSADSFYIQNENSEYIDLTVDLTKLNLDSLFQIYDVIHELS